jgi:hypothetical protein
MPGMVSFGLKFMFLEKEISGNTFKKLSFK